MATVRTEWRDRLRDGFIPNLSQDALRLQIDKVREALAENGCDCECDHHPEEHDGDCVRCFACKVSTIVDSHPERDPK